MKRTRDTTAEPRLDVRLVFAVPVALERTATHGSPLFLFQNVRKKRIYSVCLQSQAGGRRAGREEGRWRGGGGWRVRAVAQRRCRGVVVAAGEGEGKEGGGEGGRRERGAREGAREGGELRGGEEGGEGLSWPYLGVNQ